MWWQRIRRASLSQQPCPSGLRQSQRPSQVAYLPPVTHTNVELNSQKPEEPNSNLKTRAACSIFKSGALTVEWRLNKSIEKINRFRGRRWAKNDFPAEFSHFKVLTALTKWAWVCACRSGTHTHTEDKMISSECLWLCLPLMWIVCLCLVGAFKMTLSNRWLTRMLNS